MTPSDLTRAFCDTIEATTFESGRPYADVIDAAGSVLALAINQLPADEREAVLAGIECGSIRRTVEQFPRFVYPRLNGHGGQHG
jgi:hypothetical protein